MAEAFSFTQGSSYVNVILKDLNQPHPKMCAMNLCNLCDFSSGRVSDFPSHMTSTAFIKSFFSKRVF